MAISFFFQGHNVNVLTIDHVTPLHEACLGNYVACVRALIDAGANVSHTLAGKTLECCDSAQVKCRFLSLNSGSE